MIFKSSRLNDSEFGYKPQLQKWTMEETYFFGLHAGCAFKLKLVMTLSELLRQLVLQNESTEASGEKRQLFGGKKGLTFSFN